MLCVDAHVLHFCFNTDDWFLRSTQNRCGAFAAGGRGGYFLGWIYFTFPREKCYLVYNICCVCLGISTRKYVGGGRRLRAKILINKKIISLQLTNYKSTKTYSLAYVCEWCWLCSCLKGVRMKRILYSFPCLFLFVYYLIIAWLLSLSLFVFVIVLCDYCRFYFS